MTEPKSTLDQQVKAAERDKLLAEAEKAKSRKQKLDIESEELKRDYKRKWVFKTEFWSRIIGTLIALATVIFYIIPLSEVHNIQITRANEKKTDSLNLANKQLDIAKYTLHRNEIYVTSLKSQVEKQKNLVDIQKNLNITLQLKVDSFYSVIKKSYTTVGQLKRLKEETFKLKNYLDEYKHSQKAVLNLPLTAPSGPQLNKNELSPISRTEIISRDSQYSAFIYNDKIHISDNKQNKLLAIIPTTLEGYLCLAFSPDSKTLYVATGYNRILLFDLPDVSLNAEYSLTLNSSVKEISVDSDGLTFLLFTTDGDITKWNKNGRLVSILKTNDKSKYDNAR